MLPSAFRDAISFLTRIPAHRSGGEMNMGAAVPWFGAVGFCLGLVQGGIYIGLGEVMAPTVAAALATALVTQMTGAFHHDGLADMADAFGGGWTVDQRLEIMKDSRLGTYGVTVLIFVIVVEIASLASLTGWVALCAAVAAHSLSRAVSSFMMIIARPARDSGLGIDYLTQLSRPAVISTSLITALLLIMLFGVIALPLVVGAYGAGALVVRLAISKIGGITGDVLGAIQQVAKITILVVVVVAAETTTDPGVLGGFAFGR